MEFNRDFERQCEEYLSYLYGQAEYLYSDCTDIDVLVQDALMAWIVKLRKGENVEYPKGFLSAVLKNKYNGWLREKYKKDVVEYSEETMSDFGNAIEDREQAELQSEEYTSVRREIGRLINIYRIVYVLSAGVGAICQVGIVWEISDTLNGLMAIPNLAAIIILSPKIISITNRYKSDEKIIKTIEFKAK